MAIHLAFIFGLLGNIVSFMVYLAPVPTFLKIYKKKSTEGFQSVPYVVGLFSAMLWIYYAFLKPNTTLLITINSVGCCIQTFYICFFLFYATKKAKMDTMKLLISMNVVGMGLIVLLTQFFAKGSNRAQIVGWICLIFSFCVFVAPLCVLRKVIKTKSVEYMPFLLSFFLTLSAVMWFFYGLLIKDYNIAIPNVLGFTLGVIQMVLYLIYKNAKKVAVTEEVKLENTETVVVIEEHKIPEEKLKEQIIDVVKLSAMVCSEIIPIVTELKNEIELPQLSLIITEDKIIKPKGTIEAS
ncbi:Bidirectional sugar transporter SWEET14 [Capsicum baccatum]|uniref:Bidirectional sugar transporter SWEET n=2 Tax=Capsicum TaxID=4071 RepID=A0A2G3A0I4_CAPAN|nr:bidirectional sugar transporter SWEET10 [Capsicum annuum]KAF3644435.1 Bidirectional sugar transporter SWEET14 [Capsicum annuum]PHT53515.1 Bidirectional sugar transporter SWEET14 [Capsicum baccatum]PHT87742.1 Bidirectional sugar transporter SWEET14 [Capsicum annuum]PHU13550.1 Bidirectional sugar transporter SWEET14 [Capsicum chinense]